MEGLKDEFVDYVKEILTKSTAPSSLLGGGKSIKTNHLSPKFSVNRIAEHI